MHYSFDVEVATKYGLNVAIFLANIAYWVQNNAANQTNFKDGHYWTFNSIPAFQRQFPFWSYEQIKYTIEKCISEELIIKSNFNCKKYDKTSWYTLTQKGHETAKTLIRENSLMDEGNFPDGSGKIPSPIPDINSDDKPDKEDIYPQQNRFNDFWKEYPRKENKKNSQEIWKRKNLNLLAEQIINDIQNRKLNHRPWLEGYIPHPTTYLNGERWNDEIQEKSNGRQQRRQSNSRSEQKSEIFDDWFNGQDSKDIQNDETYLQAQVRELVHQPG